MKVGLFFGSFNPIHTGHLIIANYFLEWGELDQVWLIVSPQNPLKHRSGLLDEKHRLYMANLAVEDNYRLRASNVEFHLPKPSYTIDTLTYLSEKYPDYEFTLLMGSDNLDSIQKWKNYDILLRDYPIMVYNRPEFSALKEFPGANIRYFNAPLLNISATFIREAIRAGKDVRYLLPDKIYEYVKSMHFYEE
jgi:nicotinate-nucleotide adenylyltransferase